MDKHFSDRSVLYRLSWILLFILTVAVRLPGLGKSIWLDEAFTLHEVYAPDFMQAVRSSDHPFLYPLILRAWSLVGEGEAFLRLPSVVFGVLTVLILMLTLQRENRNAAMLVGLMGALSPALLRFSQEIRGYALLLLFTALAFYFANRLLYTSTCRLYVLGLTISLSGAVLSHMVGVFLIPTMAGYLACYILWDRRRDLLRLLPAIVLSTLIFGLYYLFILSPEVRGRSGTEWGEPVLSAELLLFAFLYLIGYFSWLVPLPHLFPLHGLIPSNFLGILMLFTMLMLFTSILLGNWRKSWPYLVATFLFWGGMAVYSLLFVVVINERTVVPGLIPLLLFVAVHLSDQPKLAISITNYIAVGILCLSSAFNWLTYNAHVPLEDWRALSAQLSALYRPGDALVLFPGYSTSAINYYAPHALRSNTLLLSTNQPVNNLPSKIDQLTQKKDTVFVIHRLDAAALSDHNTYPALELTLARQFDLVRDWQWGRLALYQYRRLGFSESSDRMK